MENKKGNVEIQIWIISASLLIIVALAIFIHLTAQEIQSLLALFVVIVIVAGNIGYLYSKYRKRKV